MGNETFFSIRGRIRRKDYLIRAILLSIPAGIMNLASEGSQDPGFLLFASLIMIASGILIIIQAVKRLHDINMSGWNLLISFIPIANIIFGLYVMIKDGTPGSNKYGEDPKGRQSIHAA